jgi:hypothetical protein
MSLLSSVATRARMTISKAPVTVAGGIDVAGEVAEATEIGTLVAGSVAAIAVVTGAFMDKNLETVTASHSVVVSDSRSSCTDWEPRLGAIPTK